MLPFYCEEYKVELKEADAYSLVTLTRLRDGVRRQIVGWEAYDFIVEYLRKENSARDFSRAVRRMCWWRFLPRWVRTIFKAFTV